MGASIERDAFRSDWIVPGLANTIGVPGVGRFDVKGEKGGYRGGFHCMYGKCASALLGGIHMSEPPFWIL